MTPHDSLIDVSTPWRWTTVARRLLLDRQARFWLREIDPVLAPRAIRARVLRVIDETPDVRTFVLEPNGNWQGHRAGQHTMVEVTIDGVRTRRCYSISVPPWAPHVHLTVKRVPGGQVSNFLHDHVHAGSVVGLSPAAGEFVLPAPLPESLLFLTGGSGITPTLAMIEELAERGALRDVVFVHYARSQADVIAGARLRALAEVHPGLRLVVHTDDAPEGPRGFDRDHFAALVPDFAERATFLCGPPGLMERVESLWDSFGVSDRLRRERFTSPKAKARIGVATELVEVRLARSGRTVTLRGPGSLLEQLERAGERPAHGCRMGICKTCQCRKLSGVVEDLATGETSAEPESIRLCVSTPRSDLELDL
jgi:ferredoxin-NADP reductase